ncbi:MAG: hypothetical protein VX642_14105 [Bdellovibrionota bacterium]|nr:hypothetical protein [Bdellovibrionota bacterium]
MGKNNFSYKGSIPASKSIMNRLLAIQSFEPNLKIIGQSQCDDVVLMTQAMQDLFEKNEAYCGSAGTVLRFSAFVASRKLGSTKLSGTKRLFSRPSEEFLNIMRQLGVSCEVFEDHMLIESKDWQYTDQPILVDRSRSSQFISGLALSSWDLPKDICFQWEGEVASDGYLQMTLEILKDLGMQLEESNNALIIRAKQKPTPKKVLAESDMSSCFAIAAIASVCGEAVFENYPIKSLQPDSAFVDILQRMNVPIKIENSNLIMNQTEHLKSVKYNLNDTPDLFPVLAVLCSFAEGDSELYGAHQLSYKESDRLVKTEELLNLMGKDHSRIDGGLKIVGSNKNQGSFEYSTDEDHRLAFAAALAAYMGYEVKLDEVDVVNKSFPEFWEIVNLDLKK